MIVVVECGVLMRFVLELLGAYCSPYGLRDEYLTLAAMLVIVVLHSPKDIATFLGQLLYQHFMILVCGVMSFLSSSPVIDPIVDSGEFLFRIVDFGCILLFHLLHIEMK